MKRVEDLKVGDMVVLNSSPWKIDEMTFLPDAIRVLMVLSQKAPAFATEPTWHIIESRSTKWRLFDKTEAEKLLPASRWDMVPSPPREELRKPQDLACSLRNVATELRGADAAVLREWDHPAFREGRCQLLEEAAAVLESPSVLASVKRLLQILK